jgi:hypothetical protein
MLLVGVKKTIVINDEIVQIGALISLEELH